MDISPVHQQAKVWQKVPKLACGWSGLSSIVLVGLTEGRQGGIWLAEGRYCESEVLSTGSKVSQSPYRFSSVNTIVREGSNARTIQPEQSQRH